MPSNRRRTLHRTKTARHMSGQQDIAQPAEITIAEQSVMVDGADEVEQLPEAVLTGEPEQQVERPAVKYTLAFTSEGLLYALICLLGIIVRLIGLGEQPLGPDEAQHAFAAFHLLHGQPADLAGSPLLTYGTLLAFLAFGSSDASARFIPFVFGSLLPLLPFFLRRELGRSGALCAAALLAFSPTFVWESRHAGNEILAAFWALALVIGFVSYLRERSRLSVYLTMLSLAGLLLSGPAGYRWLPVLVVLPFALHLLVLGFHMPDRMPFELGGQRRNWAQAGLVALLVVLAIATGGFSNLRGIQDGLIGGLAGYGAEWGAIGDPAVHPAQTWLRLVFYETALLVMALPALVWWWSERRDNLLLSGSVVAAGILLLVGAIVPVAQPAILPLTLLAGAWLGALATAFAGAPIWRSAAFVFGLILLLLLVFTMRWATIFSVPEITPIIFPNTFRPVLWPFILLPVLLFAGFCLLAWTWLNRSTAITAIYGAILVALLLLWVHDLRELNEPNPKRPYELTSLLQVSPDVRALQTDMDTVADILNGRTGPGQSPLPIRYDVGANKDLAPVLAWYLRYYQDARPAEPEERSGANVFILPPDQPSPFQSAGQQGGTATASRQYTIATRWHGLDSAWYDIWRWFLFRDNTTPLDRITLVAHVGR